MNKVVDLLEKHVQWVAIGLGGAYLLFMVYRFVILSPAEVRLDGQSVSPGKVDQIIAETTVQKIEDAMHHPTSVKITESAPQPNPVQQVGNIPASAYACISTPIDLDKLAARTPTIPGTGQRVIKAEITQLPLAPPPTDIKTSTG